MDRQIVNILINRQGFIKLSDFGLSKVLDKNIYANYFTKDNDTIDKNETQQKQNDVFYNVDLMKNTSNAKTLNTLSKLRKRRIVHILYYYH